MSEPTDEQLLRSWATGEEDAGAALVRRHYASLFGFFRNKVDGPIEDLTQGTFLACVEALPSYRGDAGFRAYLFGIARNQLLRWFRRRARDARSIDFESVSIEDLGQTASQNFFAHEVEKVIAYALRRIPIDLQIAVELYYWEGLSTAEIAVVTEVAAGTVKSRLAHARELLRVRIAETPAPHELQTTTLLRLDAWAREVRDRADDTT